MSPSASTVRLPPDFASLGAAVGAWNCEGIAEFPLDSVVLPPLPPHDEFERALHINPQSRRSLREALERTGFVVRRIDHWEPPQEPFFERRWDNMWLAVLDVVRFLRPFSRYPPLNRLFSNHIWVVAERR